MMTFREAAERQHNLHSYYTIWLVAPDGAREFIGYTQRKSGRGLWNFLRLPRVQERVKQFPNADTLTFEKTATALVFSNGWRLAFGGTIRQEAAEQ